MHTPYAEEVARLQESVRHHWVGAAVFDGIKSAGGWHANCAQKAASIRRQMDDGGVIYVDADAQLMAPLTPQDVKDALGDGDVAAHFFPHPSPHLCSGTLIFSGSPTSVAVLDEWEHRSKTARANDQKVLEQLLVDWKDRVRVTELGSEWCWIDKLSARQFTTQVQIRVYHHQASRRLKKVVGR